MDIEDIKAFYVAAKLKNITRASDHLGLTRGAISKRIKALESELKVQLFQRSNTGIDLTEEGAQFFEYAESICEQTESIKNKIQMNQEGDAGPLRMIATLAIGGRWFSKYLDEFLDKNPSQKLEILFEEEKILNLSRANTGTYVGLTNVKPNDMSYYIASTIGRYHLYPYAHPSYLEKKNCSRHIASLDGHHLICYKFYQIFPDIVEDKVNCLRYLGRGTKEPRMPRVMTDDVTGSLFMALGGNGIALLPKNVAEDIGLVQLDIKGFRPETSGTHHIYFLYPHFLKANKRIRKLKAFIMEKAKEGDLFF